MKRKLLALTLALTLCFGSTMTVNAAIPMLPGSGALSSLNNDNLTIKDLGQTNTNDSKSYKSNYTKLELNLIKSLFDPEYYAKQNPDVVLALGNNKEALWNHYVSHGLAEGRQINKDFNVLAYSAAYPDLQKAFGDDILAYYVHYMNYGKNENRQLTTLEKAASAGITVTGMNGQVISNPTSVVPKINLVNNINSNSNSNENLASTVQGTINTNNNTSPSSGAEDKKPEEDGCQHEYKTTNMVINDDYHAITKKCAKCGDVVEGKPEGHYYSIVKECGNGKHSKVCEVCGAVDSSSLADHEFQYTYQDGQYHESKCKDCGYSTTERHEPCNFSDVHYHGEECTVCGGIIAKAEHQFKDGVCTICSFNCPHGGQSYDPEAIDNDQHILKTICATCGKTTEEVTEQCRYNYTSDDAGHYGICTVCGRKTEKENHNYQNGKCSVCNYEHKEHSWNNETGECSICGKICRDHQWSDGKCTVCGYECSHDSKEFVSAKPINSSEHEATYKCNICNKECTDVERCDFGGFEQIDDTYHGEKCGVCGNKTNKMQHDFYRCEKKDDNKHTKYCKYCDYSVDEDHYDNEGVRSLDPESHGKLCDTCGGYFNQEKHTFGEDGKCTVCGADCTHTDTENVTERIDDNAESHKVITKCKDCGQLISEETVDHNFGDWQYEAWYRHIQVCSDCDWTIIENCDEQGNFRYDSNGRYNHTVKCNICNGEWTAEHVFEYDACIYCGVPENKNSGDDDDYGPGILDDEDDYDPEE